MIKGETLESVELYSLAAYGLTKGVFNVFVREPLVRSCQNKSTNAAWGWAALAGGVVAWDMFAPETLSEGVDRALEHNKPLTYAAVGTTALHLLNMLPESIDPIHQFGKRARSLVQHK